MCFRFGDVGKTNQVILGSNMGDSKNNGTPKSSILIGFSIINHPFWCTPIFGNIHMSGFFIVFGAS